MVILTQDDNQSEVRIKRQPEGSYFDEYVKVGDREKGNAQSYDRYIIPEPGVTYTIEITLKKGYQFYGCQGVMAVLVFPGQRLPWEMSEFTRFINQRPDFPLSADWTRSLEHSGVVIASGNKISGGRLAFREISIGRSHTSSRKSAHLLTRYR